MPAATSAFGLSTMLSTFGSSTAPPTTSTISSIPTTTSVFGPTTLAPTSAISTSVFDKPPFGQSVFSSITTPMPAPDTGVFSTLSASTGVFSTLSTGTFGIMSIGTGQLGQLAFGAPANGAPVSAVGSSSVPASEWGTGPLWASLVEHRQLLLLENVQVQGLPSSPAPHHHLPPHASKAPVSGDFVMIQLMATMGFTGYPRVLALFWDCSIIGNWNALENETHMLHYPPPQLGFYRCVPEPSLASHHPPRCIILI
ncbi:hypothetical protein BDQ17DRAFT_1436292 [Cyathus striatus]|nr:hypothetical protein BDQ17DRAFT_1436292 [Cyathus striatus]